MSCYEILSELGQRRPVAKRWILVTFGVGAISAISAVLSAIIASFVCPFPAVNREINKSLFVLYFTPMFASLIICTVASVATTIGYKNKEITSEIARTSASIIVAAIIGTIAYIIFGLYFRGEGKTEPEKFVVALVAGFAIGVGAWVIIIVIYVVVAACKEYVNDISAEVGDIRNKLVQENPV